MLIRALQYIARWEWGQQVLLALFGISAAVFFQHTLIWPGSGKYVRVVILSTDEFSLKSCIEDIKDEFNNVETVQ